MRQPQRICRFSMCTYATARKYQNNMYLNGLGVLGIRNINHFYSHVFAFSVTVVWSPVHLEAVNFLLLFGSDAIYILSLLLIAVLNKKRPVKKSFVLTSRVKRLLVLLFALSALFHMNSFLPFIPSSRGGVLGINIVHYIPGLLLPLLVLLGNIVILPVENRIKRWYFNDAAQKLSARDTLIKIGIAGSYGKTSTKFILGTILLEKWNTLVTPQFQYSNGYYTLDTRTAFC